ncbi:reverse transcriptase domain-containing protein [Tanacetum coccineum]
MTLELADRSITRPKGFAEDVFVKVGKFHFPTDFVVVDFEADPRVPLILERSFLRTGRALIDVYREEITLRVNDEAVTFNINQTTSYSSTYDDMSVNRIDVIDVACEEYAQEVLGFSNNSTSGNPTPTFEPIISDSSPSLTPFEGSDFILEEIEAYLKDDSISPEIDHANFDPKGDICLIERLLNNDPFQLPSMDLKQLEGAGIDFITRPKGIAEDVFVKVGKFHFPTDFVVVDFDADPRVPLILGRSFLRTGRALIDVYGEEITLRVNNEAVTFNINQTTRYSSTYDDMSVNRIDVIDVACEEYAQEVLGFSNNSTGGNPTPTSEPIISDSSLSLTPFEGSDLILEEIEAYLKDDSISPKIDHADFDLEGDLRLIEELLNNDPSSPLPLSHNPLSSSTTSSSSSLTPVETSDALLEEFADELTLLEPFPPGIGDDDFDPEGDIFLLEKFLNDDPSSPLPPKEFNFEKLKMIKSSIGDFSSVNIYEEKYVTFSNPLFNSNDDFTSSDEESSPDEDVLKDNVKIYSNPLFAYDDEYISSDLNPLFDEVLEEIESKDSYVSNLYEPALLVTPLFDANEDECFDPGGVIDEIDAFLDMDISTDIENSDHD